jgi:hypothetical protein
MAQQLSYAGLIAVAPFVGIRLFSSPLNGVAFGMLGANVLGAIVSLFITYAATHRVYYSTSDSPLEGVVEGSDARA